MNQLKLNEVYEYVEKYISSFHQKRLKYITTTTELDKILQQKNHLKLQFFYNNFPSFRLRKQLTRRI